MTLLLVGTLTVALAVAFAVAGLYAVRRSVSLSSLRDHHDVAGFFIGVIGVIYAVLLAFVVIVVWEDYGEASQTADAEASQLVDLHWLSEGFSTADRDRVQEASEEYATAVIDDEWEAMADGGTSQRAEQALAELQAHFTTMEPAQGQESALYGESLRRLSELNDSRAERLHAARTSLHGLIWALLSVGAVLTISFTYFFGVANLRAQALMTAGLTTMIGVTLFLIVSIDHPFQGDFSVDTTAFDDALEVMTAP